MLSLLLRNLFFAVLQPGMVTGLFPYWIAGQGVVQQTFDNTLGLYQYAGILLFLPGLVVLFICIFRFATEGRGTLSPLDPTKRLVIRGLYRYSRNPMYIGVVLMLAGEAFFFQSGRLCVYLVVVFVAFNLFIFLHEEPRLRKEFGEEYTQYCKQVRRWI